MCDNMQLVKGHRDGAASQGSEEPLHGLFTLLPPPTRIFSSSSYLIDPADPGSSSGTSSGYRASSDYVKLNVGGSLFYTTKTTLTKHDTMLRAMFSGRMEVQKDPEGELIYDSSIKNRIDPFSFRLDNHRPIRCAFRNDSELFARRELRPPRDCEGCL